MSSCITNDSVREQTKLVDLPLVITDRRHAILGHVIRLPDETPADSLPCCSTLSTFTKGSHLAAGWKRPTGRPRKTWLQQVITDQDCDIWLAAWCSGYSIVRRMNEVTLRRARLVMGWVTVFNIT